nr:MAG TPA: hypothetical protein [Caudoviricetes sp.]
MCNWLYTNFTSHSAFEIFLKNHQKRKDLFPILSYGYFYQRLTL